MLWKQKVIKKKLKNDTIFVCLHIISLQYVNHATVRVDHHITYITYDNLYQIKISKLCLKVILKKCL